MGIIGKIDNEAGDRGLLAASQWQVSKKSGFKEHGEKRKRNCMSSTFGEMKMQRRKELRLIKVCSERRIILALIILLGLI